MAVYTRKNPQWSDVLAKIFNDLDGYDETKQRQLILKGLHAIYLSLEATDGPSAHVISYTDAAEIKEARAQVGALVAAA